jgi:DMSO/TMAO reductase YedYZ molybdopterin-dependent catalytic subunit
MKLLLLIVLATMVVISGCVQQGTIPLSGVEISEYEGEPLSPTSEIRDVSIKGPQEVDIGSYRLEVTGLVDNPKNYTYDEVLSHQKYSKVVQLNCVMGWSSKNLWEGVLLSDLLSGAGVRPEADTAIFYAVDGYSTSFPLDYIMNNNILLAYKVNNVTLDSRIGFPFVLVAEQKWGYKWIKWVSRIELSSDSGYEGYWESRGYSNNGSLENSFYG